MANETILPIVGNLTADPELRFTQSGVAVANFTIASTPRIFDKQKNEWVDGEPLFMRCTVWRDYAEHISDSLEKGMQVIAIGRLKQTSFEDREGNKRTIIEMDVDEVGPALRFATAAVTRIRKGGGFASGGASKGAAQGSAKGESKADTSAPAAEDKTAADVGAGAQDDWDF